MLGQHVCWAGEFFLQELDLGEVEQDRGEPQRNKSLDGHPMFLDGKRYTAGIGTHAKSRFKVELGGNAESFLATVGVDDEVDERGSVTFKVIGDGRLLWESGIMRGGQTPRAVNVPLAGVRVLELVVDDAGDGIEGDHADWAQARVVMLRGEPKEARRPLEPAIVRTPRPGARPQINGPRVVGTRPGSPFLFLIPATGAAPLRFEATGLPAGLRLEGNRIVGALQQPGSTPVRLRVRNSFGSATRELRVVGGEKLALTPPLGWNSWNVFGCDVDAARVRAAADALVKSGLAQHGWAYINIDDCWQGARDATGRIQPNAKFPDMRGLCDYVHNLGLKIGAYSSPGPRTCASHEGSFRHEEADVAQYASWGFDYLKYDWCSYGNLFPNATLEQMQEPYRKMRVALDKVPRDIVYSLCQYGMGNVWEWGPTVGANSWRTTGDIVDTWNSMSNLGFAQAPLHEYAGPGHWNDPDMLVVGHVGWGSAVRPTRLTPNEQYTHISLWAMQCAPLLLGCDLTRLDDFTIGLLTNDEVLEVNQDPLGQAAARRFNRDNLEVWSKSMEDGSKVVGIFNMGDVERLVTVPFSDLGITPRRMRDLWPQKDLPARKEGITVRIGRHGVSLLRLWE